MEEKVEEKVKKAPSKGEEKASSSSCTYDTEEEEEEEEEEEDYYEYYSWIDNFCSTRPFKRWYCRVSDRFICDNFNLYQLSSIFKNYEKALMILRDEEYDSSDKSYSDSSESSSKEGLTQLEYDTQYLYMLIHQRYITSPEGLDEMYDKFHNGVYGTCPRVACKKQHVLPYGLSTNIGVSGTLVFCPRCKDIYFPKNKEMIRMDGAAFGPNFATLFLSDSGTDLRCPRVENCKLEIFGFKYNERARRLDRERPEIAAPVRSSDSYNCSEKEEEEDDRIIEIIKI
jgi:casein kinase II subunit beta